MRQLPYRLSLAALLLAVTLPFLGAHHFLPIATFYQEWLAGTLGLLALLPLAFVRNETTWFVPRTALLPLAITLLAWIQFAAGVDVRFESTLLLSLYMVWAFLLMIVTCRIEAVFGRENMADALAGALLAGALLAAGTGALQLWAPWLGMPYVFPSTIINGNIAQANSFADYLWIGIAAAFFLHGRGRLNVPLLCLALPILLGFSLLSGSRSVYFYAVALSIWLAIWGMAEQGNTRRRLMLAALSLLPALLALQFLMGLLGTSISSAQRLVAQGSYDPVRLTLWRAALDIFMEHPFLGAGFDSFSREYHLRIEQFPINGSGIPEHSHNILTEVLAEFGLAGLTLLIGATVAWLHAVRAHREDTAKQLAIGVLLVLGIHSSLEYPLWYAHFLAIFVLMLALGDSQRSRVDVAQRHRLALVAVGLAGIVVLFNLRQDYVSLEEATHGRKGDGSLLSPEAQQERLIKAYAHSLWRQYAALQFAARMPIESKDLDVRIRLLEEVIHFSPIRQALFRHAALLQLNGQEAAAAHALKLAMLSYPGEIPVALNLMRGVVATEPALAPLIEMLKSAQGQRSF